MPRRCVPMKDVASLRKAVGKREQLVIHRCPNGATPSSADDDPQCGREPGELNHLMYPEETKVVP